MPKSPKTKIFLIIIAIFLLIAIGYVTFYIIQIDSLGKKISFSNQEQNIFGTLRLFSKTNAIDLPGMEKGQINILLMGIAGVGKAGTNLTDTIMVASINTKTNQVALLSVPRDFYVEFPGEFRANKINTLYSSGLSSGLDSDDAAKNVEKAVTTITGLDIDYYVILNFDGFIKIIDSIGGININNERDIYDPRYPGPNYSYEIFDLKKGFYKNMDGATALKYARERHNDPEGDFGRAKRQQQILQAAKNKIFSANTLLNVVAINNLFDSLGNNIKTNIKISEYGSFLELVKKIDTNNINNVVLDAWNKDSLLKVSHVIYGDIAAFVLIPRVGNYSEIHELADNIFDLNKIKKRRQTIADENANIAIINKSGDSNIAFRIKKLLNENLNYKNVMVLNDNKKDLEENSLIYDLSQKSKPYTLDELSTRLPANLSENISNPYYSTIENTDPDILVVLGKDLSIKYNMEEASVEDYKNAEEDN